MIDVTHTVTIDRPVSEVFDFVAESSNEPKWDVDVQEVVQPSQGPLTAGHDVRVGPEVPWNQADRG